MKNQRVIIGRTNRTLTNQGYTYNEAGLTYNQIGVKYGGLTGSDIIPLVSKVRTIKPKIRFSID